MKKRPKRAKPSSRARIKEAAILLFIVTIVTTLASFAFFEEPSAIIRNDVIAFCLFLLIYLVWLRITADYEKMFRLGLGR